MKITFPHLGNTYIAMKAMFDDLGVKTVVPPKITKKTLDIGTKLSPEQICIPFKYTIGNYIEAIEKGADTIAIVGGIGSCRFGYFSQITKEIFLDLGYNVEFIVLEYNEDDKFELIRRVKKMMGTNSYLKIIHSLWKNINILKHINTFEQLLLKIRAKTNNPSQCNKIYSRMINAINNSYGSEQINRQLKKGIKHLKNVPVDEFKQTIKIGIVGEIYILIDDKANFDIAKKLNDLGAEVEKSLNTSLWITNALFYKPFGLDKERHIHIKAMHYIKNEIGGHGRETIGSIIDFAERGYDGIIQVMPFTCMPEIIAMSIIPEATKIYDIPVMTIIIDEMTGEAGINTRLEAFVDMIKRRNSKIRVKGDYKNLFIKENINEWLKKTHGYS